MMTQWRIKKVVRPGVGISFYVQRKKFFSWKTVRSFHDEYTAKRYIKEELTPDIISYMEPE
jgi:hypothetical protein